MRKRMCYVIMVGALMGILAGCNGNKKEIAYMDQSTTMDSEITTEEKTTEGRTLQKKTSEEKITTQNQKDTQSPVTTEQGTSAEKEITEQKETRQTTEKAEKKTTEKKKKSKKKKEKITEEKTTENTTEAEQSNKDIAKGYVGKTLDSLVAAIGGYKNFSKAESCYYEGEYDGIAQFDGFTVYCHSEGQTIWYIDSVE
ncbi:MAG: hypothetical protein K2L07_11455 [Lachnospiraceae bacterium]|nr:hypothetical protein [Lachnospiraceae bacterium]